MKKLLFLATFLLTTSFVSATSIDLSHNIDLEQNAGEVSLGDITVVFDSEINSFDIVLNKSEKLIFGSNTNYNISDDHKRIHFQGDFSGEYIFTGITIRTYDKDINTKLGLNYIGDEEADVFSSKYIDLDERREHDDNMKPLAVSDLTYKLETGNILITRKRSPDLDIVKQVLRVKNDVGYFKDYFLTAGVTSYELSDLDLDNHSYTIEVYAKDIYFAGESSTIEISKNSKEELVDPIVGNTTGTRSPYPIKYQPQSDLIDLVNLADRFDIFLENRLNLIDADLDKKVLVRTLRNDIIKILEDYTLGNIEVSDYSKNLVSLIKNLVSNLE